MPLDRLGDRDGARSVNLIATGLFTRSQVAPLVAMLDLLASAKLPEHCSTGLRVVFLLFRRGALLLGIFPPLCLVGVLFALLALLFPARRQNPPTLTFIRIRPIGQFETVVFPVQHAPVFGINTVHDDMHMGVLLIGMADNDSLPIFCSQQLQAGVGRPHHIVACEARRLVWMP